MTVFSVQCSPWAKLEARCNEDLQLGAEKGFFHETSFDIFRVTADSEIKVGHTYMTPLPGCCGIVVSHCTSLTEMTRHSGLSNPFRELKEKIAKDMGYTMMLATTDMANIPAVGNFFKSKYKFVDTFINKRTNHLIGIGLKRLS
jgi:hypothetical protein